MARCLGTCAKLTLGTTMISSTRPSTRRTSRPEIPVYAKCHWFQTMARSRADASRYPLYIRVLRGRGSSHSLWGSQNWIKQDTRYTIGLVDQPNRSTFSETPTPKSAAAQLLIAFSFQSWKMHISDGSRCGAEICRLLTTSPKANDNVVKPFPRPCSDTIRYGARFEKYLGATEKSVMGK